MKKIIRDGSYNILTFLIPAILMIIATPLLTEWLGMERYGIWILCSTLLGLFGLLDFGLKETAITFIPKHLSSGNDESLLQHLNSLLLVNFLIGIFSSLFFYAMSSIIATRFFSISHELQAESVTVFKILSIGLLPSLSINLLSAIAMGFQRFDLSTTLIVIRNLITILGTIFIAATTKSIIYIIGYAVVVSWIFMLSGLWALTKSVPLNRLLYIPSIQQIKEIISFGGFSFITNTSLLAMGVFDKIIIGVMLSPAAVALYSIPMSLVAKLEQFFVKFAQALFPYFSKVANNDSISKSDNKQGRIFGLSIDASLLIGFGVGAFLFIFAEHILRLWMGADFAIETKWIFRGLLIGYIIKLFNVIPSYILYSIKKPQINALAYTISGLIYIGLLFSLIDKVSLGAISFCAIAYLISFCILAFNISKSIKKSILWHLLPYSISSVISALFISIIIIPKNMSDLFTVMVGGLFFFMVYFIMSLLFSVFIKNEVVSYRVGYFFLNAVKPFLSGIKK